MRAWVRAHRWLCGLFAAVLLFSQLAAQAYACEFKGGRAGHLAPALATSDAGEHEGCAGHRSAAPEAGMALLCKAHCQADEQSVNNGPTGMDVPPAEWLAVALWPVLDLAAADAGPVVLPEAQSLGPPEGTPPLFLTLQVLRN